MHFVDQMDEVLALALESPLKALMPPETEVLAAVQPPAADLDTDSAPPSWPAHPWVDSVRFGPRRGPQSARISLSRRAMHQYLALPTGLRRRLTAARSHPAGTGSFHKYAGQQAFDGFRR